jgi:hypothetical protein
MARLHMRMVSVNSMTYTALWNSFPQEYKLPSASNNNIGLLLSFCGHLKNILPSSKFIDRKTVNVVSG